MIKLILDTNIIYSDHWLQGTNFKILFEGKKVLPMEVYMPEIVIDEAINHYKENLEEKLSIAQKTVFQLNKHLKNELAKDLKLDLGVEVEKYRQFLNSEIKSRGIKILPYPQIDHKRIVEHDLKRLKPFKKDGSGYRDYLIWHSVEKEISIEHEVIFVTANTNDFGSGPEPHPDLPRRPWGGKIKIIPSLNVFNESHITKHLTTRDKLKEDLKASKSEFFDIYEWTKEKLVDAIKHEDWIGPIVFGLPERVGSTLVTRLENIIEVKIEDVFEIADGKVLVHCEAKVNLRFSVSVSQSDYEFAEVRELFGDLDIPTSATMWPSENLVLGLNFILDSNAKKLLEFEVASVESSVDRIEFEPSYGHS